MSDNGTNTITAVSVVPENEVADWEKVRRLQTSLNLGKTFEVDRGVYINRDAPDSPAFVTLNDHAETKRNDNATVNAMVSHAMSKGWEEIQVTGTAEFVKRVTSEHSESMDILREARDKHAGKDVAENTIEEGVKLEKAPTADAANETLPKIDKSKEDAEKLATESEAARVAQEARRIVVSEQVHAQYRVAGSRYYFKDSAQNTNVLAFKAADKKIATSLNTERVSASMVAVAETKGWDSIKVSGHKEFRRQVWREASARGIAVAGYEPDKSDEIALSHLKKGTAENVIEQNKDREVTPQKAVERDAKPEQAPRSPKGPENVAIKPGQSITGRLLAHGPANYKHDPEASPSYFARLGTKEGEKVVWGKQIPDAIKAEQAQLTDDITLTNEGRKPVTVRQKDKATGKMMDVHTHRNSWSAKRIEQAQTLEKVTSAIIDAKVEDRPTRERLKAGMAKKIDQHQGNMPTAKMYDTESQATKVMEPEKKRTREREISR